MLEDLDFDFDSYGRFFKTAESKYCSVDVDTLMNKWSYPEFCKQEYWVDMKEDLESINNEDQAMIDAANRNR